jgi:hypothetical protein
VCKDHFIASPPFNTGLIQATQGTAWSRFEDLVGELHQYYDNGEGTENRALEDKKLKTLMQRCVTTGHDFPERTRVFSRMERELRAMYKED